MAQRFCTREVAIASLQTQWIFTPFVTFSMRTVQRGTISMLGIMLGMAGMATGIVGTGAPDIGIPETPIIVLRSIVMGLTITRTPFREPAGGN
ncbi:MAG: hypothetical protein JNJ77_02890 [Planctomycetia bacterium]|nr:hypothetical protein [Planctomycetia bacterium]